MRDIMSLPVAGLPITRNDQGRSFVMSVTVSSSSSGHEVLCLLVVTQFSGNLDVTRPES